MIEHKIVRQARETDPATGEVRMVEKVLAIGLAQRAGSGSGPCLVGTKAP